MVNQSIKPNVTNSFNNNQDIEKIYIVSEQLARLAEKKTVLDLDTLAASLYNISIALGRLKFNTKSDCINRSCFRRLKAKLKALSYEVEDLGNIFELLSIKENE